MKNLLFCAFFGTTFLCAAPTEQDLLQACKSGNVTRVATLLNQKVPANKAALEAAFESGSIDIVTMIFAHSKNLYVPKQLFTSYCDPKHAEVARWILENGQGKEYSDPSKLTISRR